MERPSGVVATVLLFTLFLLPGAISSQPTSEAAAGIPDQSEPRNGEPSPATEEGNNRIPRQLLKRSLIPVQTAHPLAVPNPIAACKVTTKWTVLSTAQDIFGNTVHVLPEFEQHGGIVEQIFHERFCEQPEKSPATDWLSTPFQDRAGSGRAGSGRAGSGQAGPGGIGWGGIGPGRAGPGRIGPGRVGSGRAGSDPVGPAHAAQCRGVDEAQYRGFCMTQHTYTYAYVVNQRGLEGWNVIRIRGGCECGLFEKATVSENDVVAYLKQSN
ncbi:hypothetical protein BV898_17141 [Hypsibius exemplaris]|uniref:Nerve growth factor-related domain-containing protein n=1 Tax=Hypsibius exemplaris TaxID=2072580 RepID=A0A9X6NHI9_HYPEX|nr:hypothetical protein BV898_17141 [Hypsibius exemplaris]